MFNYLKYLLIRSCRFVYQPKMDIDTWILIDHLRRIILRWRMHSFLLVRQNILLWVNWRICCFAKKYLMEASRQTSSHLDFTIDLGVLGDLELANWHRSHHGVNCGIPEVVGVRIRKGGDETNVLCASCDVQGVGRLSFNAREGRRQLGGSPLVDPTCAIGVIWLQSGHSLWGLPGIFLLQTPTTVDHRLEYYNNCPLLSTTKNTERGKH